MPSVAVLVVACAAYASASALVPLELPDTASSCTGRLLDDLCFAGCTTIEGRLRCIGGWQPRDPASGLKVPLTEAAPAHVFPVSTSCPWSGQRLTIALLHLPKTSGQSLIESMAMQAVNFTWAHVDSNDLLEDHPYDLYIITTRDPLDATVSAFNFYHPIGGDEGGPWATDWNTSTPALTADALVAPMPTESDLEIVRAMYDCFPDLPGGVNQFAEALAGEGECSDLARRCLLEPEAYCSWLSNSYSAFLAERTGILDQLRRDVDAGQRARFFVVTTDDFSSDLSRLSDWLCLPVPLQELYVHTDFPRHDDVNLSTAGHDALVATLSTDYHIMNALYAVNASAASASAASATAASSAASATAASSAASATAAPSAASATAASSAGRQSGTSGRAAPLQRAFRSAHTTHMTADGTWYGVEANASGTTFAIPKAPLQVGDVNISEGNIFFSANGLVLYSEPPDETLQKFFDAGCGGAWRRYKHQEAAIDRACDGIIMPFLRSVPGGVLGLAMKIFVWTQDLSTSNRTTSHHVDLQPDDVPSTCAPPTQHAPPNRCLARIPQARSDASRTPTTASRCAGTRSMCPNRSWKMTQAVRPSSTCRALIGGPTAACPLR